MKRLVLVLAVVASAAALAQVYPAQHKKMENCANAGTTTISLGPGKYRVEVFDEDIWFCIEASTCTTTNGSRMGVGRHKPFTITGAAAVTISCRSVSATGDIMLTPTVQQGD